jgi:dCMP deaminase
LEVHLLRGGTTVIDYTEAMRLAMKAAMRSHDESKKNGAVLTWRDGKPIYITAAYNQFPRGVVETEARWERPAKYRFVEHAERGALYQAARCGVSTQRLSMVCPWAACTDCARAIIQCDIERLVTLPRPSAAREKGGMDWVSEIADADAMLAEAGVEVLFLDWQPQPA